VVVEGVRRGMGVGVWVRERELECEGEGKYGSWVCGGDPTRRPKNARDCDGRELAREVVVVYRKAHTEMKIVFTWWRWRSG
jgi:hypothetical protein